MRPLCFVLMPFGRKKDAHQREVDFDQLYARLIRPAVENAGMEPFRADEEQVGGAIHKPMFERLMLCDYAIAVVTGDNPNVYYELGVRHALRPRSTVIMFAEGAALPFDIAPLRGIAYAVDAKGRVKSIETEIAALTRGLIAARDEHKDDSPLFQLIVDMPRPVVDHAKTDLFRKQIDEAQAFRKQLEAARAEGIAAVRAVAAHPELQDLRDAEFGVVKDLYLSYRALGAFDDMIALYARMPAPMRHNRTMREQLAFALNRAGRGREAETVLLEVNRDLGPSTETYGLLGRVYKDRWEAAEKEGRGFEARGHLKRAIDAYVAGFELDWRDAYPGVNAVTLMEMQDPPDPRQADLLPVVRYSASRHAANLADYWDHATLLELAVLAQDRPGAQSALGDALAVIREPWEPQTTARNLRLIQERRTSRGGDAAWIGEIVAALNQAQTLLGAGGR
jgi:hypothetical protein